MRIMFISDIHGVSTNLEKVKERFEQLNCDKLVVLGDLYYVGPRNKMHEDYNIPIVEEFLNSFNDKIICIKGNCDSEVDAMISPFPIINELGLISVDNNDIYLTHGHIHNETNWKRENSILVYGHFHIPFIKEVDNKIFINPGSISFPKENNLPTYMIYDNNEFNIYDIYGNIVVNKKIK